MLSLVAAPEAAAAAAAAVYTRKVRRTREWDDLQHLTAPTWLHCFYRFLVSVPRTITFFFSKWVPKKRDQNNRDITT